MRIRAAFFTILTAAASLTANAAGTPLTGGHALRLFPTGDEFTAARVALIRSARKTIYWAAFSWKWDETGKMYIDELCRKSSDDHVDVRLLVESIASKTLLARKQELRRQCGIRIMAYNPVAWDVSKVAYVQHEKLLIVDGKALITGGSNQGDYYRHASRTSYVWHDMDARIDGPVACWFHDRFVEKWRRGYLKERLAMNRGSLPTNEWANLFYSPATLQGCEPVVAGTSRVGAIYADPIESAERPLRDFYIKTLRELTPGEEVRIFSSYYIPDPTMTAELVAAAGRGIKIKVLTNSRKSNDESSDTTLAITMASLEAMRGGIEVFIWGHTSSMHRKGIVFGNRLAVIGSDNFDQRSQDYSSEAVAVTDDPEFIATLTREFALDLGESRRTSIDEARAELAKVSRPKSWFIRWIRKFY